MSRSTEARRFLGSLNILEVWWSDWKEREGRMWRNRQLSKVEGGEEMCGKDKKVEKNTYYGKWDSTPFHPEWYRDFDGIDC